jgi:NAD(P)-dependent dehydrogenase (short-subunit alcohol dehydrogenase family)
VSERIPGDWAPAAGVLAERVVRITGAGDGLGRAAALASAGAGATVILAGRTEKKLEATHDAIVAAGGSPPALYPIDFAGASWADYAQLAATLEREFGALHGLVHCAARFTGFVPLADLEPRDWLETLQVNLTAPFALTRWCLPLLLRADDAAVVFVTDPRAKRSPAFRGAYGIAKRGLEELAATFAAELEHQGQVRFNTLAPAKLRTGLRRRGYPGEALDAAPSPESAAPAILYLLARASRGRTGLTFLL